jgi:hypothetical protein
MSRTGRGGGGGVGKSGGGLDGKGGEGCHLEGGRGRLWHARCKGARKKVLRTKKQETTICYLIFD